MAAMTSHIDEHYYMIEAALMNWVMFGSHNE